LWQNGSTDPVEMVTTGGLYYVQVNLNGCLDKDSVYVSYIHKPIFTLGRDTSLCTGQTLTLYPEIMNASFVWQDGSDLPYYTVSVPGTYRLTATNTCGSTTSGITISKGLCDLYMPNAFTPNGDGLNDLFRVKYPGFIKAFDMEVYNRFGQLVFSTTNPTVAWDGTYKGADQPAGLYVWKILLTNIENQKQVAKGIINLCR
jgi:gliding motility-associated-like protein